MKVLRDPLGRPIDRLYFKTEVLDERCERKIADFMESTCGAFSLPIPTAEIIHMIAAEAGELDLYANLPEGLDGYTDYFADRNPNVKISQRLAATRYHNRLRFTLAHEYGHVWFHAPLWRKPEQDPTRPATPRWTCHRDTIGTAPENDWMEWQADHIGGALLMPRSYLFEWAGEIAMREGKEPPLEADSELGRALMQRVMRRCQVSEQAARVRLLRVGLLMEPSRS
jgi:Zn-dependent peptidase ImmA (M78 family)